MRLIEDPIEVRHEQAPQQFIWRGRLYVVRAVVDHWRERRAWWREVTDPSPVVLERGLSAIELEADVWRVEASAGRADRVGVYDLGRCDRQWQLVRCAD